MLAHRPEFRIFDEKLTCCQLVKVYLVGLLLGVLGGFFSILPYAAGTGSNARVGQPTLVLTPSTACFSVAGSSAGSGRLDWCFLGTFTPST